MAASAGSTDFPRASHDFPIGVGSLKRLPPWLLGDSPPSPHKSLRHPPKGWQAASAYLSPMTQQTFRLSATVDRPSLFIRRQPSRGTPVLYVHCANFASALSVGFDFGNGSWLADWNGRGFDAW